MKSERPLHASIAIGLIVAMLVWIALWFFWATRAFVLLMFVALAFGVTLGRGADLLERWHVRRSVGALAIVLVAVGLLALVTAVVAPQIGQQFTQVESSLSDAIDRIEASMRNRSVAGVDVDPQQMNPKKVVRQFLATQSRDLTKLLFPFLTNVLTALAGALVVVFLAIYIAIEPRLYARGLVKLFPQRERERVEGLFEQSSGILRQWLVARLLAMVAIGVITALGLWAIGVPAFAALGVIAALLEFIPFFGPIVSALPAIAMALTVSPAKALWVIALFLVVQQLEGNLITPLLMRNRIDVPPLVTIAAVTALGMVFGILGMLIAEPLSALVILAVRELHVKRMDAA
jgi:predicted PurR-regulated permease PerM